MTRSNSGPRAAGLALLLLAVALLAGRAAAAPATCGDLDVPLNNTDTSPGFFPAGPALVAPGGAGYTFVVNATSDELEFYVQSDPGVGNPAKTAYTRQLSIALSGRDADTWEEAVLQPDGCRKEWARWLFADTQPADLAVTASTTLGSAAAEGTAPKCVFTHHFALAWDAKFRNELLSCGFDRANNGTFLSHKGRVHVRWADYDSMANDAVPVHTPASTWYDVVVNIQVADTVTTNMSNETEIVYVASSISVGEVAYLNKRNTFSFRVAYEVKTYWPYYIYFPDEATGGQLVSDAQGQFGSNLRPLNTFSSKTWTNPYKTGLDGHASCSKLGDVCYMKGELTYTWKPTMPNGCRVDGDYQLNFHLGCDSSGSNIQYCGQPMRDVLQMDASWGRFNVPEAVLEFCASFSGLASAFPKPGQFINLNMTLYFKQAVNRVDLLSYDIVREDLFSTVAEFPAQWSLWTSGGITAMGTNVLFTQNPIMETADGLNWTIVTRYRPNMDQAPEGTTHKDFGVSPLRRSTMIIGPEDIDISVSMEWLAVIRVYTLAGRRLRYRDMGMRQSGPREPGSGLGSGLGKRQTGGNDLNVETQASYTNNTPIDYLPSFFVTSVTYVKEETGLVTANVHYELDFNWPWYAYFPQTGADNALVQTNPGTYAGLELSQFPQAAWAIAYDRNGELDGKGDKVLEGELCMELDSTCAMHGTLSYSWMPTPGTDPASCSLSSDELYQLDVNLGCREAAGIFGPAADCTQPLRTVLQKDSFAAWKLQGNIDFCKSAATDFGITWTLQYDIDVPTQRTIGQPITAKGSFTILKKLAGVKVAEFRVFRSDLTAATGNAYWSLWNGDGVNPSATDSGAQTTVGTNTAFAQRIVPLSEDGKSWGVETSFTPNIKLTTTVAASTDYADRPHHMIVLPWDRNADLTFTTTLKLRLFGDTVQTPGNSVRKYRMGRRLVWREVFVEREYQSRQLDGVEEEIPVEADDVVLKTRAVSVAVGDSYNAAAAAPPSSGSSSGLPTAAIVGICVGVGAILLGAALGAGVVIHRRRAATKQREELERQADEAIEASFRKHGGQKK